jgi:competence protein ComGC
MVELQLKKEKLDKEDSDPNSSMLKGDGYVVTDRNSLLEKLKGLDKDK